MPKERKIPADLPCNNTLVSKEIETIGLRISSGTFDFQLRLLIVMKNIWPVCDLKMWNKEGCVDLFMFGHLGFVLS